MPGVRLGRLDHVGAPLGDPAQDGSHHFGTSGLGRHAYEHGAGPEVPVRGAEPELGGNVENVARIGATPGHFGRLGHVRQEAELVHQPGKGGAGGEHDPFEPPGGVAVALPGDDGKTA